MISMNSLIKYYLSDRLELLSYMSINKQHYNQLRNQLWNQLDDQYEDQYE